MSGWKTASKKPVANQDIWQCIDNLKKENPTVVVKWVRGYSGLYGNELADNSATVKSIKQVLVNFE
ncbi:RNase H family protein [Alteromonas gracilis]|uniref:RNase H family protein n=1 Tax=Alteromonas gracilis TaxID=1479524 RepID=UPI003735446B